MPKDPARNQPNYKIGGSQLNEFEFNQQHGALTEEERHPFPGQRETTGLPGEQGAQETEAERVARMMKEARAVVAKRRGGGQKASGAKKTGGGAKKAAKKSAAKGAKKVGAKSGSGKSAAKKPSGAKKSAKKSGGAKGSKKRGARGR